MADFNFLDLKMVTDTINKKVTLNFNTLRGTFILGQSSTTSLETVNGIYLKIDYSSTGTATSITIDLKTLSLPIGDYFFIECEIKGTPKNPNPNIIARSKTKL